MSLLHYLDNEQPDFGGWDAVVQSGEATALRSEDATFGETGQWGLRFQPGPAESPGSAYVHVSMTAIDEVWIGAYLRLDESVPFILMPMHVRGDSTIYLGLERFESGTCQMLLLGALLASAAWPVRMGGWQWVVLHLRAGSGDGLAEVYVDHQQVIAAEGLTLAGNWNQVYLGAVWMEPGNAPAGPIDLDEVRIATDYPEPFVPAPEGDLPQPRRTAVLLRGGDADSEAFGQACIDRFGLSHANLVRLPAASATETLDSYATFQAQVEQPLADHFARCPTVAANCTCIVLGHGLPGYFDHEGSRLSATSRLARFGQVFAAETVNPLTGPANVTRLTPDRLGSLYLTGRVDAATLAESLAMLDRAQAVAALPAIPDTEKLLTDDGAYLASADLRKLRVNAAPLPTGDLTADAMVFASEVPNAFADPDGSRVLLVNGESQQADSLRTGSGRVLAAIQAGYAAALGLAGGSDSFDIAAFFEMLRIGGTFAEAVAVAAGKLDAASVSAGWPLMTVPLAAPSHNVYIGPADPDRIDFTNPVGYANINSAAFTFAADVPSGQTFTLAVRAVSAHGVEEHNTHVLARGHVDEAGTFIPDLPRASEVSVADRCGTFRVSFLVPHDPATATPDRWELLGDAGTGTLNADAPLAVLDEPGRPGEPLGFSISADPRPTRLAVRAALADRTGSLSRVCVVPTANPPATPTALGGTA